MTNFRVLVLSIIQNILTVLKGAIALGVFENSILGQIDLYKTALSNLKNIDFGISAWARSNYEHGDENILYRYIKFESLILFVSGAFLLGIYSFIFKDYRFLFLLLLLPLQHYSKFIRFLQGSGGQLHKFLVKEVVGSFLGIILLFLYPSILTYFMALAVVMLTTIFHLRKHFLNFLIVRMSDFEWPKLTFIKSSKFAVLSWTSLGFTFAERYSWVKLIGFDEIGKSFLLIMALSLADGLGTNIAMRYYTFDLIRIKWVFIRGLLLSFLFYLGFLALLFFSDFEFFSSYQENLVRLRIGLELLPFYFFSGYIGFILTKHVGRAAIYISIFRTICLILLCVIIFTEHLSLDLIVFTRFLFVFPVIILSITLYSKILTNYSHYNHE